MVFDRHSLYAHAWSSTTNMCMHVDMRYVAWSVSRGAVRGPRGAGAGAGEPRRARSPR